jgi:CRP/FNR family transcriptional regulator, cyclic AMP receptor protein
LRVARESFEALFEARESVAFYLIDAIGDYLIADMRQANRRLQEVFGHPAETLRSLRRRVRDDSKA